MARNSDYFRKQRTRRFGGGLGLIGFAVFRFLWFAIVMLVLTGLG